MNCGVHVGVKVEGKGGERAHGSLEVKTKKRGQKCVFVFCCLLINECN